MDLVEYVIVIGMNLNGANDELEKTIQNIFLTFNSCVFF